MEEIKIKGKDWGQKFQKKEGEAKRVGFGFGAVLFGWVLSSM